LDTNNGVAGTESFVNGVADKPVDTWASAQTLASAVGIADYHLINGSAVTLDGSTTNSSLFGDNWSLALGGQVVTGCYIQGAAVSGVSTGASEVHFEGSNISTASIQYGHFDFCGFDGTMSMTETGSYKFHNCYSSVAGASWPTFTKTAGKTVTGEWRNYAGGIALAGIESTDTFTIGGTLGTVTLGGADGVVEIRGTYKEIIDNRTGSPTLNIAGAIQTEALVDAVWDEPFTEPSDMTWAGATPRKAFGWLFAMFRNKATLNRITGAGALRNDADSGDLATWTVTDASSITTDGEKA
jgi:hypothetical protein